MIKSSVFIDVKIAKKLSNYHDPINSCKEIIFIHSPLFFFKSK